MQDSIKQRLTLFINNKNISTREFERNCHLSNGYINSMKKGLGLEKLENILHYYPELNREWLLAGKGEMIKGSISLNEASEQKIEYGKNIDYKEKYCEVLEKYYQLSEENKHLRSLLEKNKKLNSQHAQDATV